MSKINIATILSNKRGAVVMEYALMVSLVALTILGGLKILGGGVQMAFLDINGTLSIPTLVDEAKGHRR